MKFRAPFAHIGLIFSVVMTGACASVEPSAAGQTRTFVGIVRVKTPAKVGDVQVTEVSGAGVGWDAGPWVGWRSGSWIVADPAKCQLLVIVRSPAQAANAAEVLQALNGNEPCMVDSSRL